MMITMYLWRRRYISCRLLLKTNYMTINQEREKREKNGENWYRNQPQTQDKTKDVGVLGNNQSNKQIFWGKERARTEGGCNQDKQREDRRRKGKWGGMISSTLQIQENTNITTINNEREIEEDGNSGQVTSQNWLGGKEKRRGEISENKYSAMTMSCALRCYLTYSFSFSNIMHVH